MKKLIKKSLILLVMISIIFVSFVGCGGFNEENAKKESRIELDKFLKVADAKTVITSWDRIPKSKDIQKVRAFVENKCKVYFTKDFINDTDNELSKTVYATSPQVFYLNTIYDFNDKVDKIRFYNNYKISSPTIDKENETITYKLTSNDRVNTPVIDMLIQMKKENGNWKLNKIVQQ